MTNATDNAQIALTDAQTEQVKVGTLLNVASTLGNDAVLEPLCAVLDLDVDEVRELLPEPEDGGLEGASAALAEAGEEPIGEVS